MLIALSPQDMRFQALMPDVSNTPPLRCAVL